MLKSLWIKGLCLTVALATSVGFAQNKAPGELSTKQTDAARSTSVGVLRYQRSKSSERGSAGLKNYHKELFGTEAPSRRTSRPTSIQIPVRETPAAPRSTPKEIQQAGGLMIPEAGALQNADFKKQAGAPQKIQQVSGSKAPLAIPPAQISVKPQPGITLTPARPAADSKVVTNFTKEAPHVRVDWRRSGDINVGQECKLELLVTNTGQAPAANVAVDAHFPPTVRLTGTTPEPASADSFVTWNFPSLDSGEERRIEITLIPSQRGDLTANANVRFTTASTSVFDVQEPLLDIAMKGPAKAMIGEPAPYVVTVTNPGTGVAHDVIVEAAIPAGLEHARGKRLKMQLGSLSPGETRSVRLSLAAVAGGDQKIQVEARAGQLRKQSSATISVLAPQLQLAVDGPGLRYVGRDARYKLTVTNAGDATTNNVRAMYAVPKGFQFKDASRGGHYDEATRTISWFVGSVNAKQSLELSIKLTPTELGGFEHIAQVVSEHGTTAEAAMKTKIEGTASLVLEVVDLDDPVEIGRETAYEVRVRNDGSKEAQNVGLSIELPRGVKLLNVKGPSQHIVESGLVVFKAMSGLAPGKTAIYQIHIQGTEEGNQRVRTRLTSDSIQEPLTVEELTRFYAD